MISMQNGNMAINGTIQELLIETARIIDGVANIIEKNTETEAIDYDFTVEAILALLSQISKINTKDNTWGYEEELSFLQEAKELRNQHQDEANFIDFDSGFITVGDIQTNEITGGAKLNRWAEDSELSNKILDIQDIKNSKKKYR